ncbi:hypothetical protein L901_16855 [Agrobacterium sp. D14]|nr:hypothetical protein L901_16855 [Agrobacterium sp. D14]
MSDHGAIFPCITDNKKMGLVRASLMEDVAEGEPERAGGGAGIVPTSCKGVRSR